MSYFPVSDKREGREKQKQEKGNSAKKGQKGKGKQEEK